MADIFTLFDWVGGLLITGALAMTALTHKEIPAVRKLLIIGGALTVLRWLMWGFTTEASWPFRSLAGALIGAILLGALPALWQWAVEKERAAAPATATTRSLSPLNQTILLACAPSVLPDTVPQNGQHELEIVAGNTGGVFVASMQQPGSKANWSTDTSPTFALVCRFINYGSSPIVNVEAYLELNIREVAKSGNETRADEIIRTHIITTPRANLGTGDRNIFEFYVRNYSEYWAEIVLPTTVALTPVGSDHPTIVGLIQPPTRGFELQPFAKNPGDARAPTPPTLQASPTPIAEVPSVPPSPAITEPPTSKPENKVFVDPDVTSEFLVGLYEGNTILGAETQINKYVGKWLPVSGPLGEVIGGYAFLGERTPAVATFESQNNPIVLMIFHGEWIDRLASISKNQHISVHGKITKVERNKIELDHCEIVGSD